jgi:predicted nucleic acid-binding protein
LTADEHEKAVKSFEAQMKAVLPPPRGDATLIIKAEEMRRDYGCSRSADSVYLALASRLAASEVTELLTFDQDLQKEAAKKLPSVKINLLQF